MSIPQGDLLALVGTPLTVPYDTFGGVQVLDYVDDLIFQRELGASASVGGIKQLAGGSDGTEQMAATNVTIFGAGPAHFVVSGPFIYHPMGKLFSSINGGKLAKIDCAALTLDELLGTAAAAPSTCNAGTGVLQHLATSAGLIALQRSTSNYIVSIGGTGASHNKEVTVINVTTTGSPLLLSAVNIAEDSFSLGPGPQNSTDAFFYVMGHGYASVGTYTTLYRYDIIADTIAPATVYTLPNAAVTASTLRTINATDIDATWTNIQTIIGPGYDQADGNIICGFETGDAVTNKSYLVKLNGTTGATIWKTAVLPGLLDQIVFQASNYNGTFYLFYRPATGVGSVVQIYDLTDGSVTQQLWNRGLVMSSQIFDPTTASITGDAAYTESTGPIPVYLGAYLAANSNTIPPHRFGRIYLGVGPAPPIPVVPGKTGYNRIWGNFP